MRALDAYDAHAEKGLEYYRRALERRGSVPGGGAAAGGAAGGGRRASDSGGGGAGGSPGAAGGWKGSDVAMGGTGTEGVVPPPVGQGQGQGGTYDAARDPRLRR